MGFEFEQLHIVSDLHIGGDIGFQIFDQGRELSRLIRYLGRLDSKALGLVLNGDIVDFLAEKPSTYLDAAGAALKLRRTMDDPAFEDVWTELGRFVHKQGRTLVLVLGNHDVELALPAVREILREKLCGTDTAARGRLLFAMDGDGFSCTVGGRHVLCLHGNEVDTWNVVDYKAILDTRRAINRRNPLPDWDPNAGTKLVIDIMNGIKKDYPFVDLLKPETKAVPAVLVALEPKIIRQLASFGPVAGRLIRDAFRRSLGFLNAEDAEQAVLPEAGNQILMDLLSAGGLDLQGLPVGSSVEDLLDQADRLADELDRNGGSAEDITEEGEGEMLGFGRMIMDHLAGRSPVENLRAALKKWLGDDQTFAIGYRDDCYRKLDAAVGPEVDFLVAGHTHLERSIRRDNGPGAYFNSGTWIRLIRLHREWLENEQQFAKIYDRFKQGTMQALDDYKGLILRKPSVVSIVKDDATVYGELRHVCLSKQGRVSLAAVPDSRQER